MTKKSSSHNFFHYVVTVFIYLVKGILGEFIWFLVGLAGYIIFIKGTSPYNLMAGLPLIVISVGFIVNSIGSQLLAIFSLRYNRVMCVIPN